MLKKSKETIKKNASFFICFIVFIILGGLLLVFFTKSELHLIFNEWHSQLGDIIFPLLTHIGDGLTFGAIVLFFLLYRSYYVALMALSSFLLSSLLAQFLKKAIFYDIERPKNFFAQNFPNENVLNFVEGVKVYGSHSFPSGHTTTAFAIFCLLVLLTSTKTKSTSIWAIVAFFGACLISFTRIYLQQHFFIDVYVGSIIGIVVSTLVYAAFESSKLKQNSRFDGYLLSKWVKKKKNV